MEILTYLKANIRYKKGTFFSIFFLMVIVSSALTAVLSTVHNCRSSIETAHQDEGTGELLVYISDRRYTKELKSELENHPLVKKVDDSHSVAVNNSDASLNGNKYQNGTIFLIKQSENLKLIKPDGSAYQKKTPSLKQGEIYVPKGLLTNLDGQVGDVLDIKTIGGRYSFTVKGIALEPVMGSFTIGYKQAYVNSEDLEQMLADVKSAETEEQTSDIHSLMIYKADNCTLTSAQFRRQLNLDTGITDQGTGSLTKDMSIHYTGLIVEIVAGILAAFILLLTIIVMIAMGHSISSGIAMDYVNLGILKSYGFSQGRIRLVLVLQYTLAQICGAAVGITLSVPLCRMLGRVFWPITAVVTCDRIRTGESLAALSAILVISGLFIFLITGKIGKISPVRAIAGGRQEIYFDSRFKAPIFKKGLLPSLAFRQLVSGKRRHVAAFLAAVILVFLMLTMVQLSELLTSKTAQHSLGLPYGDCYAEFLKEASEEEHAKVEQAIEQYSPLDYVFYFDQAYFSIDGEEIMCMIYQEPKRFAVLKGREPIYDNEVVITEILADDLGLKMGDEVVIGYHGEKQNCLVSGIFQSTFDTGMCFGISGAGAKTLGFGPLRQAYYGFKEPEKAKAASKALNHTYSDMIKAEYTSGVLNDTYQAVFHAVRAVIWFFSIIFAFVVVQMVCEKAYLQEKMDIGIYKALGFTVPALRLQFAFRFFFVAVAGAVVGTMFAALFSNRVLSVMLRGVGITNPQAEFTAAIILVPAVLICLCFFVFAYLASGRIRRVAVRELVME